MYRKRQDGFRRRPLFSFCCSIKNSRADSILSEQRARFPCTAISGTPLGTFRNNAEKLLGQLCS